MTDIDQEIERRVAAATRIHNLKQVAGRLHEARNLLKLARDYLRESGDDANADRLAGLIVNDVEGVMWNVEQAIRAGGPSPKSEGRPYGPGACPTCGGMPNSIAHRQHMDNR